MKIIESTQNKTIKERSKLLTKKGRNVSGLFLIEGEHLIQEAFKKKILKEVYLREDLKADDTFPITYCVQNVLNKLSQQQSNTMMIGVCKKPIWQEHNRNQILILDNVQDPGNLGTLIRTAYSFGMDAIYLSNDCADIYNPKTIQSSQGALFHIPIFYCELVEKINEFKKENLTIYATSLHEPYNNLQETSPASKYAIILGNEGQGIRPEIIELCDQSVKIEMAHFESLNVAIAGAIMMYTFKQKD